MGMVWLGEAAIARWRGEHPEGGRVEAIMEEGGFDSNPSSHSSTLARGPRGRSRLEDRPPSCRVVGSPPYVNWYGGGPCDGPKAVVGKSRPKMVVLRPREEMEAVVAGEEVNHLDVGLPDTTQGSETMEGSATTTIRAGTGDPIKDAEDAWDDSEEVLAGALGTLDGGVELGGAAALVAGQGPSVRPKGSKPAPPKPPQRRPGGAGSGASARRGRGRGSGRGSTTSEEMVSYIILHEFYKCVSLAILICFSEPSGTIA